MGRNSRGVLSAIMLGGIVAGTIDILAASLISGKDVIYILHIVAGGLLGRRSLSGGMPTALLGLLLQELMGIIIAARFSRNFAGVNVGQCLQADSGTTT